ncbi:MAG: hypothetical protein SFV81_07835 [Pirellulaceae bacterium]|nr:hypothetical protein [Pirellulaceae bacterium]
MGSNSKTLLALGFITVRHHVEHGYFGGYLILNQLGRPLEFHCTLPVKPSRAQSLLYGPTLDDFICGEQISKALVTKAKLKPSLLLTDCSSVLAFEQVGDEPIALVDSGETSNQESHLRRPHRADMNLKRIGASAMRCSVTASSTATSELLSEIAPKLAPNFDLTEPFQRIAEALLEAHPIVKAA